MPAVEPVLFRNPARVAGSDPSSGRARGNGAGGSPLAFHRRLPGYAPTRVVDAPGLAGELGVATLSIKDE